MRVKLEDVCERGSSNIKQSDIIKMSGNYPIYGASGLAGKVNFYHQEQPYVAVVKDGAGIGRTTLNPAKSSVIGTMQYLIPKKNVLPEYLFYVVSYMHLEKYYTGATIPHIYFKDYKNEEFNLDNIEKQLEIIDVLGRCKKVIEARKQELVELDSLTKARFVELFDGKYPEDTLLNLCNIVDYRGKTPEKVEHGLPFITAKNVKMHHMTLEPREYISKETYDKVMVRGFPKEGDVVFTTEAPLGNVCRIPHFDTEFYIGQRIVTMQTDALNPTYLEYALSDEEFVRKYMGKSSGSTVTGIRVRLLQQLTIPVPARTLQDEFSTFVNQVDKSKFDTMTFAPIYAIINLYLHTYFYQGRR